MRRPYTILALGLSAFLAVGLAGAPAFARGGGGHGGGGHGGGFHGGGGHMGGGFRGGGGFHPGGGAFRGGGGYRGFSGGARAFAAPRAPNFGGYRGSPAFRAPAARMPNLGASRGFAPGRVGPGAMAGRAGLGARPPIGGMAGRPGMGNFRSFGNTGFVGLNRGGNFAGVGRGNAFVHNNGNTFVRNNTFANRTNFGGNVNRFASYGYGGFGGGRGYNRGFGYGWRNPYYGYHRNWINGYWGGFSPFGFGGLGWGYPFGYGGLGYGYGGWGLGGLGYGYGGWGLGGLGYGLGLGLSNWLYGSSLYGYGYMPYANPYYSSYATSTYAPTYVAAPYDYSTPINTLAAAPAESVSDSALALFDSARAAFRQGDYPTALQQANDALAKTPNDTALHEFRALCLFAVGRYDEAATTLYAVLSVGPGWDWPTLIGLYPSVDVYTTQLRALEADCSAKPDAASSRFVLAYHYLCAGHFEAAAKSLKRVVALKPNDSLSAKLLEQLESAPANNGSAPPPPAPTPATTAADTTPPDGATIFGTWNAQPTADTSIALTIDQGGPFTWQVTQKGQTQQFAGSATFGGGVLTLAQSNGTILVGRVSWKDLKHMTFRVVGDSPTAPGLSFSK